jgi:hypothetical protein
MKINISGLITAAVKEIGYLHALRIATTESGVEINQMLLMYNCYQPRETETFIIYSSSAANSLLAKGCPLFP